VHLLRRLPGRARRDLPQLRRRASRAAAAHGGRSGHLTYVAAYLDEIDRDAPAESGVSTTRHVRRHFGILAFGVNGETAARAGDLLIGEHDEAGGAGSSATGHEELYCVLRGAAAFVVDGERVELQAGGLLYLPDPASRRSATALEDGTALLAVGGAPGRAYEISAWERRHIAEGHG
jgi:hypothetical protein